MAHVACTRAWTPGLDYNGDALQPEPRLALRSPGAGRGGAADGMAAMKADRRPGMITLDGGRHTYGAGRTAWLSLVGRLGEYSL
jgi:hypothetical protein